MEYKNYLKNIKNFSAITIEIYQKYATKLEEYNLDYEPMLEGISHYSINTKRLIISSMISYYKFLNDGRWKKISLPKKQFKFQDFITFDEYKNILFSINQHNKTGFAKRVIIRLLFETGIRASELIHIKKQDIKDNCIKIHGKGNKERIVKLSKWLTSELLDYAKDKIDKIFNFGYKNLYNKVRSLDQERRITPHMFRRGYAKHCHDNNVSIYDISLSMGHSNIETTASYIKRKSEDTNIHLIF